MSEYKITSLLIENSDKTFAGIVHIHDLINKKATINISNTKKNSNSCEEKALC